MNKVDVGNLDLVEDVRFLQGFIPTVGHKTVTNDEWTLVNGLQRWFQLAYFVWVWMLSIFLIMSGRI
jgi:hypothetical protein